MHTPSIMTIAFGTVAVVGILLLVSPKPVAPPPPRYEASAPAQAAQGAPTPVQTASAMSMPPAAVAIPSAPASTPQATQSVPAPAQAAAATNTPPPSSTEKIAASWKVPDVDKLQDDIFGQTVRYGRDLITKTTSLIGPDAKDPAMRFAGSGLTCQSCHLQGGTQQFGLPLAGTWGVFPIYIGRENNVRTLEDRINGCMERSVNGHALPPDGPEMKAMVTYIRYISGGEQVGKSLDGRGSPALPLPEKAADPVHGQEVFKTVCAACHGADGQGQRLDAADAAEQGKRYQFPPLWGPDSYNDGAGMARTITAARFVHANMPYGTSWQEPQVSPADSYDVMAFVNSQPRPHKADLEADYPDRSKKPADAGYPPFVGPFTPDQHRYGPWKPIETWMKTNAAEARAVH
jgi:thiosulfate dehydrogenase